MTAAGVDALVRPYDALLAAIRQHSVVGATLVKVEASGATDRWAGYCPVCNHETLDLTASTETSRGKLRCSRGCSSESLASALGLAAADAIEEPKLRRLDVDRMAREEPPPVEWIVDGLVVRGQLTLLHGREGDGKSLLAMACARGVACGQPVAGIDCKHGRVLIVDAENGEHEIHRRVHNFELPAEQVEIFEANGFDLRHHFDELERVVAHTRPDLIVLDSYRSLWGGEENDSAETAGVLDPLRRLAQRENIGILLLHHSEKMHGDYRGSTAAGASAVLVFKLARDPADPEQKFRRYLETRKCRPAAEPPTRWLRLEAQNGRVFIDEAEPHGAVDAAELSTIQEQTLAVLTGAEGPRSLAEVARALDRKRSDGSIRRALAALEQAGRASQRDGRWQAAPADATRRGRFGGHAATGAEQAELERVREKFPEPRDGGHI